MIKKVIRPAIYSEYNPELIKSAIIKSNQIYNGGLSRNEIESVYELVLETMKQ
jgi:hypothetical protein